MMQSFLQTLILRHRRENLRKCSLAGLEARSDILFYAYPHQKLPDLSNYFLLVLEEAPPLSEEDKHLGVLLLDSTWRYLDKMLLFVDKEKKMKRRTLPGHFVTAYPRRQEDCQDPLRGLSSIEALYISYSILGRNTEGLLDNYYWKKQFLELNKFT